MAHELDSIRHDEIQVGDWLTGPGLIGSDQHGPVVEIGPGRRHLTFRDGAQVALSPGGSWPAAERHPAGAL